MICAECYLIVLALVKKKEREREERGKEGRQKERRRKEGKRAKKERKEKKKEKRKKERKKDLPLQKACGTINGNFYVECYKNIIVYFGHSACSS